LHVDTHEDSSDVDKAHDHGDHHGGDGGEGEHHHKFKIELILYHDGTFLYCW